MNNFITFIYAKGYIKVMGKYYDYGSNTNAEEETWDLRQFYTRYISFYMMDYKSAMDIKAYSTALDVLDEWHGVIHGRVAKKITEDGEVVPDIDYNNLRKKLTVLANKHKLVYLGRSKEPEAMHEMQLAFKKIKEYLIFKMDRHELFGKRRDIKGL